MWNIPYLKKFCNLHFLSFEAVRKMQGTLHIDVPMEIVLSTRGLSNPGLQMMDKNFTFKVGKSQYHCSRFYADFISPTISQIHLEDPFFDCYDIEIDDDDCKFQVVMDLMQGKVVSVTDSDAIYLREVGKILGNSELVEMVNSISTVPLTVHTVFNRLFEKQRLYLRTDEEIDFIAAHMFEVPEQALYELDATSLYYIMNSHDLQVESEDTLFNLIKNVIMVKGHDYRFLLSCLLFEFLSVDAINDLLEFLELEDITGQVFESMKRRLKLQVRPTVKHFERYKIKGQRHEYIESEPFNGILNAMNNECTGNADRNQLIEITASSQGGWNGKVHELIDYGWTGAWGTQNVSNSWIMIDFKDKQVFLTGYSLRAHNWGRNSYHLKSWVLEGSHDAQKWSLIDEHSDSNALNGPLKYHTWKVKKTLPFRYIRVRQTAKNAADNNHLTLHEIELFGAIVSS